MQRACVSGWVLAGDFVRRDERRDHNRFPGSRVCGHRSGERRDCPRLDDAAAHGAAGRTCHGRAGCLAGAACARRTGAQSRVPGAPGGALERTALGRARRFGSESRARRPTFRIRRLARQPLLQLPQAVLPAHRALRHAGRRADRDGRRSEGAAALCREAMDRRHVSGELRRDESGRAARGARQQRGEPGARSRQPDRRRPQGAHQPDRRVRVRSRTQPRDHAGTGGLRKRADSAHPIHADDGQGSQRWPSARW